MLCGSIIGIERELRGKPTGMRTCTLICLGTALFVSTGSVVGNEHTDPTRVVGQVVTGIGFLGGGVILARGDVVTGVTTASVVWLLAAIGTMIGAGQFSAAVAISFVAVAVLILFEFLENLLARFGLAEGRPKMPCRRIDGRKARDVCGHREALFDRVHSRKS